MTGDDAEPTSPSHPGPAERREALRVNLARIAAPDRREFGERMADAAGEILEKLWAFWRPAFERAYREGYPPPGYQPADELEKAAALASFMGTGVARR